MNLRPLGQLYLAASRSSLLLNRAHPPPRTLSPFFTKPSSSPFVRFFFSSPSLSPSSTRQSPGVAMSATQPAADSLSPASPNGTTTPANGALPLAQIRERLRAYDVDCNGRLDLTLDNTTGIATLCINSPTRKNAFSGNMMAQFSDLLSQLEAWKEGRAIIIYGADGFFCSGADLKTVARMSDTCGAYYISTLMHDNFRRLNSLPLVSVALVEGSAIGGGAEVVANCDLRVFTASATIGFVHARLGVTPGFGGGVRLIRLLGQTKALQMMLSARPVDVGTARELGLVEHILPEGLTGQAALESTIEWYGKNYGSITPFASREIKMIINKAASGCTLEEALHYEATVFQRVWGSEEHKKALASNIKHNGST